MTITFALNKDCEVYIGDTCKMTKSRQDASYWLRYKEIISNDDPLVIPAAEIATWADRLDEDRSFYAMFYTKATNTNRKLKFYTSAPADADPEYPAATIAVVCEGTNVVVNVSAAQTIVVTDATGGEQARWDAVPDTPHTLSLPVGIYTLQGENEKIVLNL